MNSLILKIAARYLFPLLMLYSVLLLFRGHHEPGGGFVGGLTAAAALVLCVLAYDVPTGASVLRVRPSQLICTGLLIAAGSGLVGTLQGQPFMTAAWNSIGVPGLGSLEVGTPLLFDVGVYLTVVGVTMAIMLTLAAAE